MSKTLKGMSNVAAATAIAIERYQPAAIVNQGTAGGHDPELRVGDIVIGRDAVNLGAFKTAVRPPGQGSDSLEWTPMDLLASEGSASDDPNARSMRRFPADQRLLAAAESVTAAHKSGRVVTGVIGSSDVWNSELDRIQRFRAEYGTSVEEMEAASAAQVARSFAVPFIGIRILSNNITNDGAYDGKTGVACQEYVYEVVRAYIEATRRSAGQRGNSDTLTERQRRPDERVDPDRGCAGADGGLRCRPRGQRRPGPFKPRPPTAARRSRRIREPAAARDP